MASQKKFESFREAMAGVKPLPKEPARLPPAAPNDTAARPAARTKPQALVPRYLGERVEALGSGASPDLLVQLKRGKFRPQAELDAHGLTSDEAQARLSRWIQHARERGMQTLLIIHGRGLHSGPEGPVLRDAIVERLSTRHAAIILGFCTAPSEWGGTGALLLRLRRR